MPNHPAIDIPVIETPRAILRGHRLDDFDDYAAMWADPAVIRLIGGEPRLREDSWVRFLRHGGMWAMLGFGFWAVEEKATGRFIGEAGFHDLKRDMKPSIEGVPEAGWGLIAARHGQGFATEIVKAVHGWGDARFNGAKTVCIVDPDNIGSVNVALKCGYRKITRTSYKGSPTILFERERTTA
ncbi:GNAT family N-acetyltransferase [Mesorhizobium sp.]|uniref:GNAT family N-acetyltransferase n=1 Tax=Mesorhizobium sp. TaxID=1871066 RepID=UPI000FE4B726|nr:GNAT family N-acetyltransferase [Mesorhizobium sp.]RWO80986.1 MAG: N-acetyltransferase [Mesorhizobium sp.]RWQ53907.1 MAG: N-acetyltransferase [Mesorhizobium sp.]